MKLYVDDIRDAPDSSWTLVKTISSAIRFIAWWGNDIEEISLDHDISFDVRIEGIYRPFPSPDTFQAVAYYICAFYKYKKKKPKVIIHTANPLGAEAIEAALIKCDYGGEYEIKMMGEAHRKK